MKKGHGKLLGFKSGLFVITNLFDIQAFPIQLLRYPLEGTLFSFDAKMRTFLYDKIVLQIITAIIINFHNRLIF